LLSWQQQQQQQQQLESLFLKALATTVCQATEMVCRPDDVVLCTKMLVPSLYTMVPLMWGMWHVNVKE
jgi:hypothetical protein